MEPLHLLGNTHAGKMMHVSAWDEVKKTPVFTEKRHI